MIRMIFSGVLAIHGIIHLMGFAKEWDLGPKGRFSGKTLFHLSDDAPKFVGILWLLTSILLISATAGYYLNKDWFLILAAPGLLLSQALIIVYWQDAKWGTIANITILIVVILSGAKFSFAKMVKQEVTSITSSSTGKRTLITSERIAPFPPIIQTWLNKCQLVGKGVPSTIHVVQKGSMRTNANGKWMLFNAEQYFTIDPPAFVWDADIHANAFMDIAGRDKYQNGKGNMLIEAASLFPMANSSGSEIDQGTLVRFMAEMIWFPQAAVSNYLTWEQICHHRARVTMSYRGVAATGIYTFNNDGLPIGFEADRYYGFEGMYTKKTWSVAITSYQYFNGIPIANKSEVTWKLKEGDFTWLRLIVTDIEYK